MRDEDAGKYRIHTLASLGHGSSSDWPYHCAMQLLTYPIDDAISQLLALMGETSGADRAWVIEYQPDLLRLCNTHEWCRQNTKPFVSELQYVPTTLIAWLHRHLMQGSAVAIHDVHALPRTARALQAEFMRQGNKSVLSVPIFQGGALRGIMGFDTTRRKRIWPCSEVAALYRCADLIGQAKYAAGRHQNEAIAYDSASTVLYLDIRGVVRGVQPDSIAGVRSAGNYSEIWLADGSMVLDSRSLGVWGTLLPSRIFFKIHRTAIANVLHVVDVDRRNAARWQITVRSAQGSWPVSRAHRQALRERMGI